MPQLGDSVAASTARAMNVARVPSCRFSGRMSGVVGQKLGRKYSFTSLSTIERT